MIALALVDMTSCAHAVGGYFVRRTPDSFSLFVGATAADKNDSFYKGAYLICRDDHRMGFEVDRKSLDQFGDLVARITCKGKLDPSLEEKYKSITLRTRPNNVVFEGGNEFEVTGASK